MSDDTCELCGGYRSSLTTRNIMNHLFCTPCGDDIVGPRVQKLVDDEIKNIKSERSDRIINGYEKLAEEFYNETGIMAPGKDDVTQTIDYSLRSARFEEWLKKRLDRPLLQ